MSELILFFQKENDSNTQYGPLSQIYDVQHIVHYRSFRNYRAHV